ncbi:MAG: hypothetical protein FJY34_11330 [Betaproteobacteria bacterium]|nr:hypothetical protein [Betaproteobacteria bacterium]
MEADYFWPPGFRPAQAGQNLYGGRLFLATRISPRASGAKSLWRPIISGHQDFAPRKRGKIFSGAIPPLATTYISGNVRQKPESSVKTIDSGFFIFCSTPLRSALSLQYIANIFTIVAFIFSILSIPRESQANRSASQAMGH